MTTDVNSDWASARGEKWLAQLAGMEATMAPVDDPLIEAARLDMPYRIADIGCGGGGTTREIVRRAPAGSVVHGFDISPALVEFARSRSFSPSESFAIADMATAAAPADGPYDRLVSRFGIMFFADPPAAFRNLVQWLAPGGRFAFAVWGGLDGNPWMTTVRDTVAEFVALPASETDAPGPFRYAEADKLIALLDDAGFAKIALQEWRGKLPIGGESLTTAAEAANFALAAISSFGEMLAAAGDGALDGARRLLTTRFSRHQLQGDAVRLDACVHIVTGTRVR